MDEKSEIWVTFTCYLSMTKNNLSRTVLYNDYQ